MCQAGRLASLQQFLPALFFPFDCLDCRDSLLLPLFIKISSDQSNQVFRGLSVPLLLPFLLFFHKPCLFLVLFFPPLLIQSFLRVLFFLLQNVVLNRELQFILCHLIELITSFLFEKVLFLLRLPVTLSLLDSSFPVFCILSICFLPLLFLFFFLLISQLA